jgi:hypothetical protein
VVGVIMIALVGMGWWDVGSSLAESPIPTPAGGPAPAPLAHLEIALWPEYDRPEVLVIFRSQLPDSQPLPAAVTFNLPSTVPALNAVAYLDESRNTLVNVPQFTFSPGNGGKTLSFSTPARRFQFEYYAAALLSKQGQGRILSFSFTTSNDVADGVFEVQQPAGATAYASDPPPSTTETRPDGLAYAVYQLGAMPAGQARSLRATYSRTTDDRSVKTLGINVATSSDQPAVEVGGATGLPTNVALILIAAGILLVGGTGGYWMWSRRPAGREPAAHNLPHPASRQAPPDKRPQPLTIGQKRAAYCHRCGAHFRDDAQFCHACGAERRAD